MFACATAREDAWLALLEKAYAKLHGCYQALEGGTLLQVSRYQTNGVIVMNILVPK